MQFRIGIKKWLLMGVTGILLLALGACAGVSQEDFDALNQQLAANEQETTVVKQQLATKEQEASALKQRVSTREQEIAALKAAPDIGFLAYWHSVPNEPERRAASTRVVAELERRTGLPGYFASHMPISNWYDGVTYLEAKGVKYFIAVYMDIQPTYGSTLTDVLQWLMDLPGGRGVDPSKVKDGWGVEKPHPSDPGKYGNVAEYMGNVHIKLKTFSNSVFIMATTPTDPGPFAIAGFERQIRAVMRDPATTSVMLVDHGAALDVVHNRWMAYRQTQADALKAKLGLKRAGAFGIREDWKDLWPAAVAHMISTANEWAMDSTVIFVPIRDSGLAGGGSRAQVLAEFQKAKWTYAPALMEIEANREGLVDWAADTITKAAAWVKANRPTSNTYYGRTEKGVDGGIVVGNP